MAQLLEKQFRAFAKNELLFSQYRPVGKMGIREATPLGGLNSFWELRAPIFHVCIIHIDSSNGGVYDYISFMQNACLYVNLW